MGGCDPIPGLAQVRRGYGGADFVQQAFVPAIDWTLEPMDAMAEATVTSTWTTIVSYTQKAARYGLLERIGIDFDDVTASQRVSFRVLLNGGVRGGDENGLMPALESRCGILDGTMCPWPLFCPLGSRVEIQGRLSNPAASETEVIVRARLQGVVRGSEGGGVAG